MYDFTRNTSDGYTLWLGYCHQAIITTPIQMTFYFLHCISEQQAALATAESHLQKGDRCSTFFFMKMENFSNSLAKMPPKTHCTIDDIVLKR